MLSIKILLLQNIVMMIVQDKYTLIHYRETQ